jgi:hypothetical protein
VENEKEDIPILCDNEREKKSRLPRAQAPQAEREMTCEDLTGPALTWGCSDNGGMFGCGSPWSW